VAGAVTETGRTLEATPVLAFTNGWSANERGGFVEFRAVVTLTTLNLNVLRQKFPRATAEVVFDSLALRFQA